VYIFTFLSGAVYVWMSPGFAAWTWAIAPDTVIPMNTAELISSTLRRGWFNYRVPLLVVYCIGCLFAGRLIGRSHARHRAAIVFIWTTSPLLPATQWGWSIWHLLRAGPFPFLDARIALLINAVVVFIGMPVIILLGGL
jgi:hypothetical protein